MIHLRIFSFVRERLPISSSLSSVLSSSSSSYKTRRRLLPRLVNIHLHLHPRVLAMNHIALAEQRKARLLVK